VLEAIIRGCPVISYGFGYGHVRASNAALQRFGLAQVARREQDIAPALERALVLRPEPDGSFARRPSTASLILVDERRARQLPVWRMRTARAITAAAATLAVVGWTLTTGASYSLVSHFVHMRPTTTVATARPEIGVLVDAPSDKLPSLASAFAAYGLHASFALDQPPTSNELKVLEYGDQALPRLSHGGLVRWLGTRDQLDDILREMGFSRHFLYASSGPSVGQWWLAHRAGGRLIAGAVRIYDGGDPLGHLRAGEVIELPVAHSADVQPLLQTLSTALSAAGLRAVTVGRLMHDAGTAV
jgi:hypothetical protein